MRHVLNMQLFHAIDDAPRVRVVEEKLEDLRIVLDSNVAGVAKCPAAAEDAREVAGCCDEGAAGASEGSRSVVVFDGGFDWRVEGSRKGAVGERGTFLRKCVEAGGFEYAGRHRGFVVRFGVEVGIEGGLREVEGRRVV
jgi:hypothetical protein